MDWTHNEVLNLLDTFTARNRCFTIREVSEWAAESVDAEQLRHSFSQDARFIRLSQPGWGPECFLPEREMFKWWAGLNLRLATIQQSRLTERQLTVAMNSLRPDSIWFAPPVDILDYGRHFGFVADAWTPGFYVFPFAHLLGQSPPMFRKAFYSFAFTEARNTAMQQPVSEAIESMLSSIAPRTAHIIRVREGLPPYDKLTLAELGEIHGCTRERIRQIESKFWKKMKHPLVKERPFLIQALIAELARRRGSLVLDTTQKETAGVRFLAKCLGVPLGNVRLINTVILGVSEFNLPTPETFPSIAAKIDVQGIGELLEAGEFAFLARDNIGKIAAAIAQHNLGRLNKAERVYLALRNIGKPAHFTEVAATYNLLFPDELSSERNVHAVLTRRDIDQYGMVWIGEGVYALTEDGYERPGSGKFDPPMSTIAGRVYVALQHIGKQAHASEVTEVYNSMFPEDQRTPENIHAVLSRCAAPEVEQYGIVWVGLRSTFALKEHGYKRPELGLFKAVAKIVADKYKETGRAVHINVIAANLGKYHQFVNPQSFQFAISFNGDIEQVSKDYFIPKAAQPGVSAADKSDDLDRILREFQADHGNDP